MAERLKGYEAQGALFAKWCEVCGVTDRNPTPLGIEANAEALATYAVICQADGIVPVVEAEVLMTATTRWSVVTRSPRPYCAVFHALHRHKLVLEYMVLKPSMVLPGKDRSLKATPEQVATVTVKVLRRSVSAAVPGICLLSGGQRPEEATANLNAMNVQFSNAPWQLSFSYGRALQDPVIQAWEGRMESRPAAQQSFRHRAKMNGLARSGRWNAAMEKSA